MNGGRGYTPKQVGDLTIDEIIMALADRSILEGKRSRPVDSYGAMQLPKDKDGFIAGRDVNGNPIRGQVKGVSKARQMTLAAQQRREVEKLTAKQRRHKRRGR